MAEEAADESDDQISDDIDDLGVLFRYSHILHHCLAGQLFAVVAHHCNLQLAHSFRRHADLPGTGAAVTAAAVLAHLHAVDGDVIHIGACGDGDR